MENKKGLLIGVLVAVGIIGAVLFTRTDDTSVQPSERVVVKETVRPGAVSSPDLASPYFGFGGVRNWAYRCDLSGAASTTICTIKAPPSASSSLRFVGYRANTGTGTVMELRTYKSASPYLTTTQLGHDATLAANTNVVVVSTSTLTDSSNALFSANDWLVVTATVSAGGAGTSSPTGVLETVFTEI